MSTIHELENTIDVETPLGYAKAIAWIDYGSQTNTVWKVVFYKDGSVRNFYDDDIRVYPNRMDGGEIETKFPSNQQFIKGLKHHFGPKTEDWMDKQYKPGYEATVTSGMFFEWYPNLTGVWEQDKEAFVHEMKQIEKRMKK